MVSARNPDGGIVLHVVTHRREPAQVEGIHLLRCGRLVPIAFVHTHHLSALAAYAASGEEVRRVGKDHVKAKAELRQCFDTITLNESEIVAGGFVVWMIIVNRNLCVNIVITRQYYIAVTIQPTNGCFRFMHRASLYLHHLGKRLLYRNIVPHKRAQSYDHNI